MVRNRPKMLQSQKNRLFLGISCCFLSVLSGKAQNLVPNGSFEDTSITPTGWHVLPGGTLTTNATHGGQRSVGGHSLRGEIVWRTDSLALKPNGEYRLEGWLRCRTGEVRLGVELLDAHGKIIRDLQASPVRHSAAWQYVALEWNAASATSARAWFWIKGQGELDDVVLSPIAASVIGNKSVDGDARGRIPLWGEEKNDALLPGRRAGELRVDSEVKRNGATSVQLVSISEWFAVSSVNFPLPQWTDALEFSGWARCEKAATAQLLACWTDDEQKVLRVDANRAGGGEDWRLTSLTPPAPPPKANAVRIVAVARGGKVWFDDFDLLSLRPRQKAVRVLVNQVGYDLMGPN